MKTISLVYLDAGGHHRTAAQAIHAVVRRARPDWRVDRVDLMAVLDPKERFRAVVGCAPEHLYRHRLASDSSRGRLHEMKLLQGLIRLAHAPMAARLARHWLETEPDVVVSLVPNFSRVLCESVARALPGVPFATLMTDIADGPSGCWIEPGLDQFIICGSDRALAEARAAGHADARLFLTGGMVLRPDFQAADPVDRAARRVGQGLPSDAAVGAVRAGALGARSLLRIARALADVPLLMLGVRDAAVHDELRRVERTAPLALPSPGADALMQLSLCDFLVTGPCAGALAEAVALGLPVVTTRNAWTLPNECGNADWIAEQGLGVVHRSGRGLRGAVGEVLAQLPEIQARCRRVDNRAAFEMPAIFEQMLFEAAIPRRDIGAYARSAAATANVPASTPGA